VCLVLDLLSWILCFFERSFVLASLVALRWPCVARTTRLFRRFSRKKLFHEKSVPRFFWKSLVSWERKRSTQNPFGCILHTHYPLLLPSGVAKFFVVVDIEIFGAHRLRIGFSLVPKRILPPPSKLKLPECCESISPSGLTGVVVVLDFSTLCTFLCIFVSPRIFSSFRVSLRLPFWS
jgi:hypothetical protein